jgi:hypothetical protein
MQKSLMLRLAICISGMLLFTSALSAGEKKLMHCFAFTAIETASDADWQAFFKATDQLPSKIPTITHVWYGKLARPLSVTGHDGQSVSRQWGVCMEFKDQAALKTYVNDPAHKAWVDVYSKVRVAGTTTYDILGQ